MNKKIFILIIVILLLVAGGIFWWWQMRDKESGVRFTEAKDFTILDSPGGKIVENKKEKLRFTAPQGWKAGVIGSSVMLASPNAEIIQTAPPEEGCWIEVAIIHHDKEDAEIIKERIENISQIPAETGGLKIKYIELAGYKGYREVFQEDPYNRLGVVTLVGKKEYNFFAFFTLQDKGECLQVFDKFLETISIK